MPSWLGVVLLCFVYFSCIVALSDVPRVILISMDGFRYDLLNKTMVPNIYAFAHERSTWFTNGLRSQYITYTAPNHMSIITGLYEESHGIVSNYFYDPTTGKFFDYFNSTHKEGVKNESMNPSWYLGEPIWLTNERESSSHRSVSFYWPNGEISFKQSPHRPYKFKEWTRYRNLSEWMSDADEIVDIFTRNQDPVNFLAWYIAEPDHTLHANGFYNGALKQKLKQLDELFAYFIKKMKDANLLDHVNIILTADHGHAEILDEKHVMCLRDYIDPAGAQLGDHMIYPVDEKHAQVLYKNLTAAVKTHGYNVTIHWKQDLPKNLHYGDSNRVGRIVVEPEVGSAISFSCTGEKLARTYGEGKVKFNSSTHGMHPDRPEMRAMLVMHGPAFLKGKKIHEIPNNIDLYGLMCQILKITPAPNNGTLRVVRQALHPRDNTPKKINFNVVTDSLGMLFIVVPSICVVIAFLLYGYKHTVLKNDPGWGQSAPQGYRPLDLDTSPMMQNELPPATSNVNRVNSVRDSVAMKSLLQIDSSDDEL